VVTRLKTKLTDDYIGKTVVLKKGFFAGLTGTIERSRSGVSPYVFVMKTGGRVGVMFREDIEVVNRDD
jgi:hypothetical protein